MLALLVAPLLDLCFNAASTVLYMDDDVQLMLFLLQDTVLVLSLIALAIRFTSTFVFQAGLIGHLLRRFNSAILVSLLYLLLSINLHVFSLRNKWGVKGRYVWPALVTVLYTVQRTVSVLHYFLYKRTILLLADPKYHRESEWLMRKIGKHIGF